METKVIYIMGAGRSGSTILDIVLGNADTTFSTGELLKFAELEGKPHGAKPGSETHMFWTSIRQELAKKSYPARTLKEIDRLKQRIENHCYFFLNFFGITRNKTDRAYSRYLKTLFEFIHRQTNKRILIDSSKYPGRALFLSKYFSETTRFIYLIRTRKDVVKSFNKKNIEQPRKNWLFANLYWFVVNLMCYITFLRIDSSKKIIIKFEDLRKDPIKSLQRIGKKFDINLDSVIRLIAKEHTLETGCLFEGNRIRLEDQIVFKRDNR